MLRKPGALLSTYGSVHNCCCQHSPTLHPSPNLPHHPQSLNHNVSLRRRNVQQKSQRREYADVTSSKDVPTSPDDLKWPDPSSATKIPTPYQIFKQKKGTPYSKRRFYELAKLYHPDKHGHGEDSSDPSCLSQAVKLERYRLIVAANDILSDPVKRNAYDTYGFGWGERSDLGAERHHWRHAHTQGPGWSGFDDNASPFRNATWEDWEKWYMRNSRGKQKPLYFSNGGFVLLVACIALLGSWGEVSRAGKMSRTFLEQLEATHDESSKDLQRRKTESQGFRYKDERVQNFLKKRDPVEYGGTNRLEENYRKLLPASEVCMSGDIRARGSNGP